MKLVHKSNIRLEWRRVKTHIDKLSRDFEQDGVRKTLVLVPQIIAGKSVGHVCVTAPMGCGKSMAVQVLSEKFSEETGETSLDGEL